MVHVWEVSEPQRLSSVLREWHAGAFVRHGLGLAALPVPQRSGKMGDGRLVWAMNFGPFWVDTWGVPKMGVPQNG